MGGLSGTAARIWTKPPTRHPSRKPEAEAPQVEWVTATTYVFTAALLGRYQPRLRESASRYR